MSLGNILNFLSNIGIISQIIGVIIFLVFLIISFSKQIIAFEKTKEISRFYLSGALMGFDFVMIGSLISGLSSKNPIELIVFALVGAIRFLFTLILFKYK